MPRGRIFDAGDVHKLTEIKSMTTQNNRYRFSFISVVLHLFPLLIKKFPTKTTNIAKTSVQEIYSIPVELRWKQLNFFSVLENLNVNFFIQPFCYIFKHLHQI